jgi:Fis family transcriptional regulator
MSITAMMNKEASVQTFAAQDTPLREAVKKAWDNYISQLGGEEPSNLYDLFLEQVELPLLLAVMAYTGNNQSRAAKIMGLSRGTLRKKLKIYGLL